MPILNGVTDQILKHMNQLFLVRLNHWKKTIRDHRPTFLDRRLAPEQNLLQSRIAIHVNYGHPGLMDTRVVQQTLDERLHAADAGDGVSYKLARLGIVGTIVALR